MFDAYYVDAVGSGRPPKDSSPVLTLTEMPPYLVGIRNISFAWKGNDDFTPEKDLQYSYTLIGYDTQWSPWGSATYVEYQDIPEGI